MLSNAESNKEVSLRGLLSLNKRNIDYISRYNPADLFNLVDNKLNTKKIAKKNNIPVPELIGVVSEEHQIIKIPKMVHPYRGFVIKPAQGSGGKGIIVINKIKDGRYFKTSGEEIQVEALFNHVFQIISGEFTLGGQTDVAVIEQIIEFNPIFDGYSYEGIPDIRLIVFKGFPVMAMLRLSTKESDGKSNLHQGAIGVGLDLRSGKSIHAVQYKNSIEYHPNTGKYLNNIQVPYWNQLMFFAASCYDISGLGYLGIDLALDINRGPLLLELNARPGLSIQIANGVGILPRLKQIESLGMEHMPLTKRIEYVKKAFTHL